MLSNMFQTMQSNLTVDRSLYLHCIWKKVSKSCIFVNIQDKSSCWKVPAPAISSWNMSSKIGVLHVACRFPRFCVVFRVRFGASIWAVTDAGHSPEIIEGHPPKLLFGSYKWLVLLIFIIIPTTCRGFALFEKHRLLLLPLLPSADRQSNRHGSSIVSVYHVCITPVRVSTKTHSLGSKLVRTERGVYVAQKQRAPGSDCKQTWPTVDRQLTQLFSW